MHIRTAWHGCGRRWPPVVGMCLQDKLFRGTERPASRPTGKSKSHTLSWRRRLTNGITHFDTVHDGKVAGITAKEWLDSLVVEPSYGEHGKLSHHPGKIETASVADHAESDRVGEIARTGTGHECDLLMKTCVDKVFSVNNSRVLRREIIRVLKREIIRVLRREIIRVLRRKIIWALRREISKVLRTEIIRALRREIIRVLRREIIQGSRREVIRVLRREIIRGSPGFGTRFSKEHDSLAKAINVQSQKSSWSINKTMSEKMAVLIWKPVTKGCSLLRFQNGLRGIFFILEHGNAGRVNICTSAFVAFASA